MRCVGIECGHDDVKILSMEKEDGLTDMKQEASCVG